MSVRQSRTNTAANTISTVAWRSQSQPPLVRLRQRPVNMPLIGVIVAREGSQEHQRGRQQSQNNHFKFHRLPPYMPMLSLKI